MQKRHKVKGQRAIQGSKTKKSMVKTKPEKKKKAKSPRTYCFTYTYSIIIIDQYTCTNMEPRYKSGSELPTGNEKKK